MSSIITTTDVQYSEIVNWPGYRVGSDGSVWSRRDHGKIRGPWRLLNPSESNTGYLRVKLVKSRRIWKRESIHVLVLEAFVGPRPEGCVARHLDDVKDNNNLDNLCWGTVVENMADAVKNGRLGGNQGEVNGKSKLTEDDIRQIRDMRKNGVPVKEIAKYYSVVHPMHIYNIISFRTWKHVN